MVVHAVAVTYDCHFWSFAPEQVEIAMNISTRDFGKHLGRRICRRQGFSIAAGHGWPGALRTGAVCGALALLLSACGTARPPTSIELMPAPAAYSEGNLDSALPERDPFITVPYQGVLYATDRAVSESAQKRLALEAVPG